MEKKSTKIAYGVACAVVVVLLVILGIVFKDRHILVEEIVNLQSTLNKEKRADLTTRGYQKKVS